MSYSRTYQPSQSGMNPRGRGQSIGLSGQAGSVGAGRGQYLGRQQDYDTGEVYNDGQMNPPEPQERRMECRGAYSVMAPNEKKRSEINRQAEEERRQYEEYKQKKRLNHVSYVGTVGGASLSSDAPPRSRLVTQQPSRYQKLEQRNRYREEAKMREEEENRKKKENARRQSELNAQRRKSEDERREELFRQDARRKNQAFLDRLEGNRQ